jgi:hypothetical protein
MNVTKIADFTDTIKFTAASLIPSAALTKETRDALKDYANAKAEDKEAAQAKLSATLGDPAKAALASVGATLPTDVVQVKLDFGAFLFDLYIAGSVQPQAPLAVAAHQRRLQEIAARLEKDSFELKPEELAVIKKVLESDPIWTKLQFSAYVEVKNDKGEPDRRVITLTTEGIRFYNKTMTAALKLFEATDEKSEQPAEPTPIKGAKAPRKTAEA